MNTLRKLRIGILLIVLCSTVGCDQAAKRAARTNLKRADSISLPGGFGELRLAENPGAFLSLGDSLPKPFRTICFTMGVAVALAGLFAYLISRTRLSWLMFGGLAMILAGGMSNLIDRITREGLVTDFITLRLGPLQTGIFNLADVIVMMGVGVLAFAFWR